MDKLWSKAEIEEVAGRFEDRKFEDFKTGESLEYSLFVPPGYDGSRPRPLVIFIHDRGVCSSGGRPGLLQGMGGVIWASEKEQAKHECLVLVPHFPSAIVNDRFGTTVHFDVLAELIHGIINTYAVDRDRIYGVGQSMGTMSLLEMGIRYPRLFGGLLLAAGQWNPETITALKDCNLWVLVSEGDSRAFDGMNGCIERLEAMGAPVSRTRWDGRVEGDGAEDLAWEQMSQGKTVNYTVYEGSTIVPDAERANPDIPEMLKNHMATWSHVFRVEALRDWLFDQRKNM